MSIVHTAETVSFGIQIILVKNLVAGKWLSSLWQEKLMHSFVMESIGERQLFLA